MDLEKSSSSETGNMFKSRVDLAELQDAVQRMRTEIGKVIIGQEAVLDLLITALLADGHVLIEGVPGVAKTLTAKLLARTFNVEYSRIQFTPDLMPSDVLGTSIFNQKGGEFEFRKGPVFSNIVLIDEINRAPAKTQAALFEAMEERQITMDGTTYKLDAPFIVLATQNPIEQEGTYRLPEAQLDRFIFKVTVDYPSLSEEEQIIRGHHERKSALPLEMVQQVMSREKIAEFRGKVREIHVEDKLIAYIARLVHDTRDNQSLYLGASPRASIAILNGAKAMAAIRGRDFVTPEDIREITLPVMVHRVILTPEREMEGLKTADIIKEIIQKIEVPR
ncbi:MAG TPA: MoxR family ATPase [Bacteroidetes bacterium]|nr:MoxR family ATPase [Bacteroidota bacterium]